MKSKILVVLSLLLLAAFLAVSGCINTVYVKEKAADTQTGTYYVVSNLTTWQVCNAGDYNRMTKGHTYVVRIDRCNNTLTNVGVCCPAEIES